MDGAAIDIGIGDVGLSLFIVPDQAPLCGPVNDDGHDVPCQVHQTDDLVGQNGVPVLQLAHLQHVVDEGQQVVGGHLHLLVVGQQQRLVVKVGLVDVQQADDAVDGGADVVAHAGEEPAFGLVGLLGLGRHLPQLGVFGLQGLGILPLHPQGLLVIAPLRPPPQHVDHHQQHQVDEQGVQHHLGGCGEHGALGHKGVDVIVPALLHQAEVVAQHGAPVLGVDQLFPGAPLHDAL